MVKYVIEYLRIRLTGLLETIVYGYGDESFRLIEVRFSHFPVDLYSSLSEPRSLRQTNSAESPKYRGFSLYLKTPEGDVFHLGHTGLTPGAR